MWVQILKGGVSKEPESWFHYLRIAARNRHLDNLKRPGPRLEVGEADSEDDAPPPEYVLRNTDRVVEAVFVRMLFLTVMEDLHAMPR